MRAFGVRDCFPLRSTSLGAVLKEWRVPPEVAIHALFPAGRDLPPIVGGFVDFLASRLAARFGATGQGGRR